MKCPKCGHAQGPDSTSTFPDTLWGKFYESGVTLTRPNPCSSAPEHATEEVKLYGCPECRAVFIN